MPRGDAGVPGPRETRGELHQLPVASNQEMRTDALMRNLGKVRVSRGVQAVDEKRFDCPAAKFAGRQRDAMDNGERNRIRIRPRIVIRRRNLPRDVRAAIAIDHKPWHGFTPLSRTAIPVSR